MNLSRAKCAAIIVAAGKSSRMMGIDKIFSEFCGIPLIIRTLRVFESLPEINEIILVVPEDKIEKASSLCRAFGIEKIKKVVSGGKTRTESSFNGIKAVSDNIDFVAIHDGARPLVTTKIILDALHIAIESAACTVAIPINATIKRINNGIITESVNRADIFEIQTPQIFRRELILVALDNALKKNLEITDDSSAVEAIGLPVRISNGSLENFKITTQEDLRFAEVIIKGRG